MITYPFHFQKINAYFLKRINRFLVLVEVEGKETYAYLPNPGRLWELLIKGAPLILFENSNKSIPYVVLGCYKGNQPVLLHTHLTNEIIKSLIEQKKIPFLENYEFQAKEIKYNSSRFDLLLKKGEEELFLEIKTCTLFGKNIAMFPDAVTQRGSKHLLELNKISLSGKKAGIIFVIMSDRIKYFMPAYHIDLNFSKNLLSVKNNILIKALSLKWDKEFSNVEKINFVEIPWNFIETEIIDKGAYLLILEINEDKKILVGELGDILFKKGYYVYVGSALNSLSKRVERHKRRTKSFHWHIDYLTNISKSIKDIPIITQKKIECSISKKLSNLSSYFIPKFGSSDCSCKSHLYYFKENPLSIKEFIDLIIYFRIDRLKL